MTVKAILKQHETRAPRSLLEADALVILEVRITVHVCFRVGSTHLSIDVIGPCPTGRGSLCLPK